MDKKSSNNSLRKSDDYYDLLSNKTFVRGYDGKTVEESKFIVNHSKIFPSIYSISKTGRVYCVIDDQYLKWDHINKYPSVNLISKNKEDEKKFSKERFLIKDLMACSYIANANDYLERGCKVVNIDGDPDNCDYRNIIFLEPEKILNEK